MCGIAGKVIFGSGAVKEKDLQLMANKIIYRGPDDWGTYISNDRKIGLANRRLKIIDLTSGGHQPMSYLSRYFITYNGEIYNFREERRKLEKSGYLFHTKSDTEVILALYDKYRERCLEHLRGMFAFAIYDDKEKTVFLVRDRLGVKPLKYFYNRKVFIFSSELKAILTQQEVIKNIDLRAIHLYLTFGYVPSPLTGFEGINKLESGHYMTFNLKTNSLNIKKYWEPNYQDKLDLSEKDWCKNILDTLEESTRLRMISDVPIGAFLSGGVDSSGVVAGMARISKKPVKTFTIGFKDQKNDERIYAQNIVDLYNTEHETLIAEPESIEELLPRLVYNYEEPYADSSSIITYMVCKMAKKYVTVVLTGDGGDENFAGYDHRVNRLERDIIFDKYQFLIKPLGIPISSYLSEKTNNPYVIRINNYLEKSKMDLADRYITYNCFFTNKDKKNLYSDNFEKIVGKINPYEIGRRAFSSANTTDKRDQALYFDMKQWLPDSQLTKVDIASMSVSLEARSPFLDYKMVELACKIPSGLKVKNGISKYILKKALEGIVPKKNLYRRKVGFTIPLDKWFTGSLKEYSKSKLLSRNTKTGYLFNSNEIKRMLNSHSVKNDFGSRLWALLALENWCCTFFN
jgi:asparagine synthase (glutamine-hydrolysing)